VYTRCCYKVERVLCIFELMKLKLSIFTFLLLLVSSSSFNLSAEAVQKTHSAEIEAVLGGSENPFGPESQGVLFSDSNTAESSTQLREHLLESSTEEETREYSFTYFLNDSDLTTPSLSYLGFSDLIHGSQTIRTLIFPFHSHL